jgi:haloacetate dehalogenase
MVGHDRSARVATRFAKNHPAMLDQLVVMDNIPTRIIFQRMNAEVARGHWFFIFNNVPDLPEALHQWKRGNMAALHLIQLVL